MKGRSSTKIGIRLEDWVVEALQKKANPLGLTVGGYIKGQIMKSISGSTTKPRLYDPATHKAGDTVLVRKGKKLIETRVPDLDAGGEPIPDVV